MQKYRVNEEVPWNEVLDIIRWSQEVHMMQLQRVIDLGKFRKNDGSLRNLRASCACRTPRRRSVGGRATTVPRRGGALGDRRVRKKTAGRPPPAPGSQNSIFSSSW